jgi:hypothetical protein
VLSGASFLILLDTVSLSIGGGALATSATRWTGRRWLLLRLLCELQLQLQVLILQLKLLHGQRRLLLLLLLLFLLREPGPVHIADAVCKGREGASHGSVCRNRVEGRNVGLLAEKTREDVLLAIARQVVLAAATTSVLSSAHAISSGGGASEGTLIGRVPEGCTWVNVSRPTARHETILTKSGAIDRAESWFTPLGHR